MSGNHSIVVEHNFSIAFEQMCAMVAVAETKDTAETLQNLILYTFARFPDEQFSSNQDILDAIYALSGLRLPAHEVEEAVSQLSAVSKLIRDKDLYTIPLQLRGELLIKIKEAEGLESKVKDEWLEEAYNQFPLIPSDLLWSSLKTYLVKAFRRHGVQTTALLDPTTPISNGNGEDSASFFL